MWTAIVVENANFLDQACDPFLVREFDTTQDIKHTPYISIPFSITHDPNMPVTLEQLRKLAARTTKSLLVNSKALNESTRSGDGAINMTGIVLSTYESPPTASGKKGATRFNVHLMSVSTTDKSCEMVKLPIDKSDGETVDIRNGETMYLSCFQCPRIDDVPFGTMVQLCGVVCTRVEGRGDYSSSKKIKVLAPASTDVLQQMPGGFFHMPSVEECRNSTVVLRFRGTPPQIDDSEVDEGAFVNFTLPDDTSNYVVEKEDDGSREIGMKGSFSVQQWNRDGIKKVFLSTRLYESHLSGIGILDPDTWTNLAPTVMRSIHGFVPGYIDKERTLELDINNGISPSEEFEYGLNFKGLFNTSSWDIQGFLDRSAFEVTKEFVQTHLGDSNDSSFAVKNPLSANGAGVANLNEWNGVFTPFFETSSKYYLVCNHSLEDDEFEEVRNATMSQRQDCLDKKPGCQHKVRYNGRKTWVFFAIKGEKRMREN